MAVNHNIVQTVDKIMAAMHLPQHLCHLCQASCHGQRPLCDECHRDLPIIQRACPACALPLMNDGLCTECMGQEEWPIQASFCVYRYSFPVSILIQEMKFNARPDLAIYLGNCVSAGVCAAGMDLPEVIIPVPLHPDRLAQRGYNQAAELARAIGAGTKIPVDLQVCQRLKSSVPQTGLAAKERKSNVKGAFSCPVMNYRHMVIIDDVVTTGSTVKEMARTLIRAGAERVDVWACARTVEPY